MLSLLANIDASQLIEKLKSFQMPSQQEYIAYLAGLEHRFETSLALIVLFGCGLLYLPRAGRYSRFWWLSTRRSWVCWSVRSSGRH